MTRIAAVALVVAIWGLLGSCPVAVEEGEDAPRITLRGPQGGVILNGGSYTLPLTWIGDWREITLTIANVGSDTLQLTGNPPVQIVGNGDAGLFSVTTEPQTTLGPGAFTTFSLRFTPVEPPDLAEVDVEIPSSDPATTIYSLAVKGSGITENFETTSDSDPCVVWTGTEYGVAWQDRRDGNWEIYFARYDETGARIGSDIRVTNAPKSSLSPSLVWTGTEYGLAWHDGRVDNWEIYFARLDAAGALVGSEVRVTNALNSSQNPSLVWNGGGYGLAWHDGRDGNWEVYFARLDTTGAPVGSEVRLTSVANSSQNPSLVWTGTEYGVAWHDGRDGNWEIYFARIDSTGAKVGGDVRVTDAAKSSQSPALAWNGSEYCAAWYDGRDDNWEIYFARLDTTGAKTGSDVRLTTAAGASQNPSVAWTGSDYAIAWYDDRAVPETFEAMLLVRTGP